MRIISATLIQSFCAFGFLIFILVASGCNDENSGNASGGVATDECVISTEDGRQVIMQDDVSREYVLHVPSSYDCEEQTPLVLSFHGFGGNAADFLKYVGEDTGLNALADERNFLVAYPQGVERTKGDTEWDPGDNGTNDLANNDVYFTEQLVADISAEFNVDPARIYAIGYSNGGMMCYGLACSKSDMIAAVGIVSGIMLEDDGCNKEAFTSVIHFHGIADGVLPYDGNMYFSAVSEVMDTWVDHNGIPSGSVVTSELKDGDVLREVYSGGNGNTSVVLYTINQEFDKEGGHVWFSDEIEGNTPNEIIWDFLSAYTLDD